MYNKFFYKNSSTLFSNHDHLNGKPLLQFIGANLDSIGFKINFSSYLGLEPIEELDKLKKICSDGKEKNLVIVRKK